MSFSGIWWSKRVWSTRKAHAGGHRQVEQHPGPPRVVTAMGLVVATMLLWGCTSTPEQPAAVAVASPPPAPPVPEAPDDGTCTGLIAAIDAWDDSFEALRWSALSGGRWLAHPLDTTFESCVVDGMTGIAVSYACRQTASHPAGDRAHVLEDFRQAEARIDQCLEQPLWYPRQWTKARSLDLSGGEQQQLWRDQQAWPRPAIQLKLEQDYDRPGRWLTRLSIYTMR